MYKYLLFASLVGLGTSYPGIIESGTNFGGGQDWQAALASAGGGGQDWQAALASVGGGGQDWQAASAGEGGGGGHDYGSLDDGQGHGSSDGSIGGDFHHGVSVVGIGGGDGGKGAIFDLTNHGGGGHQGAFGGSFVASSKYSGGGNGGGGSGGHGGHGYGVSEGTGIAEHYSDVLGASESVGGQNGGHEGLAAFQGSIGGGDDLGGYH